MSKVLFVGSDAGGNPIQANLEGTYIQMAYLSCKSVRYIQYPQVLLGDLADLVGQAKPTIFHITCHGSNMGLWLATNPASGDVQVITTESLFAMLSYEEEKVVFIDACQSEAIAKALFDNPALKIKLAIGHSGDVNVAASYLGARAFHGMLSRGASYRDALDTMRSTVHMIDRTDRVRCFADEEWLEKTLIPPPPKLVARFAKDKRFGPDRNGVFHIEFGAAGFPAPDGDPERCVVSIFSDASDLVGGAFTTVEGGFPHHDENAPHLLTFWTNDYDGQDYEREIWEIDEDFRVFMAFHYNNEYDIVKTTLRKALLDYYDSKDFNHPKDVRDKALKAIKRL